MVESENKSDLLKIANFEFLNVRPRVNPKCPGAIGLIALGWILPKADEKLSDQNLLWNCGFSKLQRIEYYLENTCAGRIIVAIKGSAQSADSKLLVLNHSIFFIFEST